MTAQTIAHGITLAVFQMSMGVLLILGLVLVVLFIMQGFENAANERYRKEQEASNKAYAERHEKHIQTMIEKHGGDRYTWDNSTR